MEKIEKIQTKSYIADEIRREILAGNIEAGTELTQENMAELLGVSRMPVREALQVLETEGFLERLPNRHMRVISAEDEQVKQIFRAAAAMEAELLKLCLESGAGTEEIENALERLVFEEERGGNGAAGLEKEFHEVIAGQPGNQYLIRIHSIYMGGYLAYAMERKSTGRKARIQKLQELVSALTCGKADQAGAACYAYFGLLAGELERKGGAEE